MNATARANAMISRGKRAEQPSVLLIANFSPDVGYAWWLMERFWLRHAEMARQMGLDAIIVYPIDGPLPGLIRQAGISTVVARLPGSGWRDAWRSIRLVYRSRARVIYLTDRPFVHVAYALYRALGVRKIVVHDHTPGDVRPSVGLKGAAKWLLHRLPWVSADRQLCVSPLIATRAIQGARIPPNRVFVVQNGIDEIPCVPNKARLKRQFDIPADALVCVTVARASKVKRIDFLVDVTRQCLDQGITSVHFIHCGDGPELPRLKELVLSAGVSQHVHFAGRRTDIHSILCDADFALHPSMSEAFSLSILEYMRAGLVLLVPDIPSVSQAVRHQETGIVYPDGEAKAVAALIAELVASPEHRDRLGRSARAAVLAEYSAHNMMEQFDAAIHPVLTAGIQKARGMRLTGSGP